MAQTKKDYERAAKIVLGHWKAYKEASDGQAERAASGRGVTDAEEANLEKLRVAHSTVMEAFVSFFRQAGGAFNVDRFRDACRNVRSTGKVSA